MSGEGAGSSAVGRLIHAAARFLSALRCHGPILVAYSGGGDSTALLWALSQAGSPYSLHAVTVDHALRPGSAEEAHRAGEFARSLGVSHSILSWLHGGNVPSLQASAREARYRLLAGEARRIGASVIVTGHNADDQAETIAMRRARGEGEGLSGMAPAVLVGGSVWVIRPLISMGRTEIREALKAGDVSWIDDPSNENPRFERIRVRGQAYLREPDAGHDRLQAARHQAAWLEQNVSVHAGAVARVSSSGLSALDQPDAATALFKLSAAIGGKVHLPSLDARKRVLAFLRSDEPDRLTLGGTVFDRRAAGLFLYRETRNLPMLRLDPGEGGIWDGRHACRNGWTSPVEIRAAGKDANVIARLQAEGVPSAIARRAAPAMPLVQPEESRESIVLTRQIAAHAAFLPSFELPIAECFGSLFGLLPMPPLPVGPDFLVQDPDSAAE